MIHDSLENIAYTLRTDVLRMIGPGKSGHLGGALSAAEMLTLLYFERMRHDPRRPDDPDRDRLVLSKGHAALILYSALCRSGYFPEALLSTVKQLGGQLEGHPSYGKVPGVEASTGSLGQGLSVACGMAAALRLNRSPARVYCLIGDGEAAEGQIWEAALSAAQMRLSSLTVLADCNGFGACGPVFTGLTAPAMAEKFRAFGFAVQEADGHDFDALRRGLDRLEADERPGALIARTEKGHGFDFCAGKPAFHNAVIPPEAYDRIVKGGAPRGEA